MSPYDAEDWKGFVASMAKDPAAELPRMMAADWITEQGDDARGELIRVQCELAGKPGHNHDGTSVLDTCPACKLAARSRVLLEEHEARWLRGLPIAPPDHMSRHGTEYWMDRMANHATWRRGFVDWVRTDWPGWRDHGDAILERHPVEVVTLTGDRPVVNYEDFGEQVWLEGDHTRFHRSVINRQGIRAGSVLVTLLTARWPADTDRPRVRFELPAETLAQDRMYRNDQYGDVTEARFVGHRSRTPLLDELHYRVMTDARREHPGDRLEWLTEPGSPRVLPWRPAPGHYAIVHQCPADPRPTLADLLADDPTQMQMSTARYSTVDLTLRPYQINRDGFLTPTHYFYAGRCAGCSTTFLMEAQESPTPTGGTR